MTHIHNYFDERKNMYIFAYELFHYIKCGIEHAHVIFKYLFTYIPFQIIGIQQ